MQGLGDVYTFSDTKDMGRLRPLRDMNILWIRLHYQIDRPFLEGAPNLKIIVSPTTGLDHIDLGECRKRGIEVLSLKGETPFLKDIPATAEHTWALILSLIRRVPWAHDDVVNRRRWDRMAYRGHDLKGKVLGIVGYGRVGEQVGHIGEAFGMSLAIHDVKYGTTSLDAVLRHADIVSLHVPLNEMTAGMIARERFALMKRNALLINTSRGEIIDEAALLTALKTDGIAGVALDVLVGERNGGALTNNPLVDYAATHENLLLTPHLGGCTVESMARAEEFMAEKLTKYLQGRPDLCPTKSSA